MIRNMGKQAQAKKEDSDRSSNVKVVVRVRPTNSQEKQGGFTNVVKVIDDYMLVFDPKCDSEAVRFGRAPPKSTRSRGTILDRRVKDLRFAFDRVFDENANNKEVFENTTKSVISSVLEGFNCSVFAYGATSAGKTHTMLGSPNHPGVIFLTMKELYEKISERKDEVSCDVSVSYLEIYNETARDLLLPTTVALAVREDPQKGVCVTGLSLHKPRSAEEILGMLEFGNQNRTQHPTDANKQSSRSHAVFQVFVRQQPKGSGLSTDVKVAKMSLIDLAGSERATVTTNRGARFREGANINRSLLALGNCINALAENKTVKGKKDIHIPYRDSKLTRLLKDSLGGNCKTIMIAALSPSSMSYEDTYNTLKYANRAKEIKSTLKSNVISVDFHVSKYAKIVEELKQQVEDLKSKMKRYESGEATPMRQQKLRCTQRDQLIVIQDELCGIYKSRCLIRKQIIDCEAAEKELKIKLFKRERNIQRIQIVQSNEEYAAEESVLKLDRFRSATELKKKQLQEKTQSLVKQLAANDEKIALTKSRADEWLSTVVDESLKDSLTVFQEARVLEVEKVSARAQTRHLRRYLLMQEKDSQCTERLFSTLLEMVFKQRETLQATNTITAGLEEDFSTLLNDLGGSRRITWADESTTESLHVTSLMNFSSCTPIQTPARKKCILQNETPKRSVNLSGPQRNLDSIAAMNSILNSKSSGLQFEDGMSGAAKDSDDANPKEVMSDEACLLDSGENNTLDSQQVVKGVAQTVCPYQGEMAGQVQHSSLANPSTDNNQNATVPSRRRALALASECPIEIKISRLDNEEEELVLPDVPTDDKLDSPKVSKEKSSAENISDAECPPNESSDHPQAAAMEQKSIKGRRETFVIEKRSDELRSLPMLRSEIPNDSRKEISNISNGSPSCEVNVNKSDELASQKEHLQSESVVSEILTVKDGSSVKRSRNMHNMNVTYDVNDEVSILCEDDALDSTYVITNDKKSVLDLSGVEPLVDSPMRQPLAVLCENRLNGNALTPKTASASLHLHGLPSMRDNSKFTIKPQVVNNSNAEEPKKPAVKDHKSPHSASKSAKSKYASVPSRLYDENPRYASSTFANRMKTKNDKRRRSTTLNNPIRLRETRRRSRTSSAAAPYNILSIKRHTPSNALGVRKAAAEHLSSLKGSKSTKHFAPSSASGILHNMHASAI